MKPAKILTQKTLQHSCSNVWLKECTLISQTYGCPKDWTNEGGTYLKSVGSASQKDYINIPVKPFHLKPVRKRMAKVKCSTSFLHIFSTCSSNFLQIFQMTKLNCFHHRSTNVCKNTLKVKYAFCSNEFLLRKMRKSRLLRQPILYLLWQSPWNISYDISCVCVCACVRVRVRMTFSASATTTMRMIENHPSMRVKIVRHPHGILRLKSMKPLTSWQEARSMKQTTGSTRSSLYGRK